MPGIFSASAPSLLDRADFEVLQASNYTLTVGRHGKVSVGQANTSTPGFETVLAQDDITRSSVYLNAACLTVSLNTTAAFVGAFVSTYDDFTSMSRQASHCHMLNGATVLNAIVFWLPLSVVVPQ